MALPSVVVTVTLSVPATGFATTAATAFPALLQAQLGAEAVRLIKNQFPSSRFEAAAVAAGAGQDAVAATLTSVSVA